MVSIIFSFISCGGGQIVLPNEEGQIPNEAMFEDQLGVLPEEAQELMGEVDQIQNEFGEFTPFNNSDRKNDFRGILNGTEHYYMGTMRFGPYPYFRKYNLEVLRLQFEQIFDFGNVNGSMLVNYYVSDQYLGQAVQENDILDASKFLATLSVDSSGEKTLFFDSNDSTGAKEILEAINDSIQENEIIDLYVYVILTYNQFDDQFTVVPQVSSLTLTVDLNLEKSNQQPTIEKKSGTNGETNNSQSEFKWEGNDPDGHINEYIISKDGATERTKEKSFVWEGYSQGQHVFKVQGIDNRGGRSNELFWTFNYIPDQKPTLQKVSGPSAQINENSATFEWSGSDSVGSRAIVKYQYKKDGGTWIDMNPLTEISYTWSGFSEGIHNFSVRAQDDEDALSDVITWSFTYAEPEPNTYVLEVQAVPTGGGDIQIESQGWKDSDSITIQEGSQIQIQARVTEGYQFDGWYNGQTKVTASNPYTLTINSDKTLTGKFTEIQNEAPSIQKVSGPSAQINENSATFVWTGSDNVGARAIVKYQYKKDAGTWTDMSPLTGTSYTWSSISEGSHSFSVRAKDDEDALSNVVTWNFTYSQPTQDIVYRALLIGIEDYDGDNDLDYTYDDVIDIQTIMNNQNYDYQIQKMGGSQRVTKAQILSKLNEYVNDSSIDSDDVFFFGYSGHGGYGSGTSYLVSSDLLAVTVSEIRAKLDQIPGTKIVSIDACQSGAFVNISGMRNENIIEPQLSKEYFVQDIINIFALDRGIRGNYETDYEYYAMAAAAIDEYSWESSTIENGYYSFFLADGVGHTGWSNPKGSFNSTYNADANNNRSITLSELYNYVKTNVYNKTVSYDVQTVQVYPSNSQYVLFEY